MLLKTIAIPPQEFVFTENREVPLSMRDWFSMLLKTTFSYDLARSTGLRATSSPASSLKTNSSEKAIRLSVLPSEAKDISSLILTSLKLLIDDKVLQLLLAIKKGFICRPPSYYKIQEPFERDINIRFRCLLSPNGYEIEDINVKGVAIPDIFLCEYERQTIKSIERELKPYIQAMLKTAQPISANHPKLDKMLVLLRSQTVQKGGEFKGLSLHKDDILTQGHPEDQPVTILAYDPDPSTDHKGDLIICEDKASESQPILTITPTKGLIVAFDNDAVCHGTKKFDGTRTLMSLFLYT